MKREKFRSIFNLVDHVPSEKKPAYNEYDNTLLSKFSHDQFASFVLDRVDQNNKPMWDKNSFLYQIEMLDDIPMCYARVYLYGVWDVIENAIQMTEEKQKHLKSKSL